VRETAEKAEWAEWAELREKILRKINSSYRKYRIRPCDISGIAVGLREFEIMRQVCQRVHESLGVPHKCNKPLSFGNILVYVMPSRTGVAILTGK